MWYPADRRQHEYQLASRRQARDELKAAMAHDVPFPVFGLSSGGPGYVSSMSMCDGRLDEIGLGYGSTDGPAGPWASVLSRAHLSGAKGNTSRLSETIAGELERRSIPETGEPTESQRQVRVSGSTIDLPGVEIDGVWAGATDLGVIGLQGIEIEVMLSPDITDIRLHPIDSLAPYWHDTPERIKQAWLGPA